jgi:hypothetical protein
VLYRVLLVILFVIALLLTLNEKIQERRSQQLASGTAPAAFGSGDAYPVPSYPTAPPGAPTATAIQAGLKPAYPVPKP